MWSVISARRPAQQMAEVRRRLSEAHGRVFELAGRQLAAVPHAGQLLEVQEFPGLTPEKIHRLHAIAHKTLTGYLDTERLRHIGPDATTADMQHLKGIGPFYASLITIRAVGFTDVPPADEPMLRELVTQLYRLPEPCSRETIPGDRRGLAALSHVGGGADPSGSGRRVARSGGRRRRWPDGGQPRVMQAADVVRRVG